MEISELLDRDDVLYVYIDVEGNIKALTEKDRDTEIFKWAESFHFDCGADFAAKSPAVWHYIMFHRYGPWPQLSFDTLY